jgi:hypothetical protein
MSAARRCLRAVLACVAVALVCAAQAAAQEPPPVEPPAPPPPPAPAPMPTTAFAADASQLGVISLIFWGAAGHSVRFYERVGDTRRALGIARSGVGTPTILKDAATWSCDRVERTFEARVRLPDGTIATGRYGVRTASCAQRFRLDAPRRVKPGEKARIRVRDQWNIGDFTTKVCITPPKGERECRTLKFARQVSVATLRFKARTKGRWRVVLHVGTHDSRRYVAVGGDTKSTAPPPLVLATGDSTMQGIDSFLSDELSEEATVQSDVQIGSAISRGNYWTEHAISQVEKYRPRVTVISVGGAIDAFPLQAPNGAKVECCEEPWIALYGERVRKMAQTYLRAGRGKVFWLTPPLPRDPDRLKINVAVNAGIEQGALGLDGVKVIRVDQLFSPNGVFEEVIRYRGRDVRVRDADGVHLNISGTAIMAQLLAPAIRALLDE